MALGSADAKNQEDSVVEALPFAKDWAVKEAGQADDLRPRGVTALRKALPGWVDLQDNDDCLHLAAHGMYVLERGDSFCVSHNDQQQKVNISSTEPSYFR